MIQDLRFFRDSSSGLVEGILAHRELFSDQTQTGKTGSGLFALVIVVVLLIQSSLRLLSTPGIPSSSSCYYGYYYL